MNDGLRTAMDNRRRVLHASNKICSVMPVSKGVVYTYIRWPHGPSLLTSLKGAIVHIP